MDFRHNERKESQNRRGFSLLIHPYPDNFHDAIFSHNLKNIDSTENFRSPLAGNTYIFHSIREELVKALLCILFCVLLLTSCSRSWQDKLKGGQAMMDREEYAEAAALFGEVVSAGHWEGYLYRGDAYKALAKISPDGGESRAIYFSNALEDYRSAAEFLGGITSAEVLPRMTALYFSMGDEALRLSDYDGAEEYYNQVLSWNHANAEAYGRLADVSMTRDRPMEAAARLEKGITATHDAILSKRLESLKALFEAKELESRRLAAAQALKGVPYFGDTSKCAMEPEQALAFARLLSDGISGKFQGFTGYGRPLYNGSVYWDEPYAVLGLGSYETDRALAVLGDFAGDGVPYLYLFSSVVKGKSFEVYGWKDGAVHLAAGVEAWGSQREGRLAVTDQGTVVLEESEPTGNRSRSGRTVRFVNGGTSVAGLQDETWDPTEETVRVTTNGVPSTYTEEEWANRGSLSTAALDTVTAQAMPLRDMIRALNGYASALGSPELEIVEVPPEHSPRHRMAEAMLRQLFALNRLSVEVEGARLCDTRLLDLDRDGQEELFAAFQGEYPSKSEIPCQFVLYRWDGNELDEYPGTSGMDELHLAKYENEYGILGAGRDPDLPLSQKLTEQDTSDPSANRQEDQSNNDNNSQVNIAQEAAAQAENIQPENNSQITDNTIGENSTTDNNTAETDIRLENSQTSAPSSIHVVSIEPYTLRYSYTFLSHSEELVMTAKEDRRSYHVVRSGRQGEIAESEFSSIRERYTVLQTLVNYRTSDLQNRNYAAVISALFQMQMSG